MLLSNRLSVLVSLIAGPGCHGDPAGQGRAKSAPPGGGGVGRLAAWQVAARLPLGAQALGDLVPAGLAPLGYGPRHRRKREQSRPCSESPSLPPTGSAPFTPTARGSRRGGGVTGPSCGLGETEA